jgi:hypothetical protein
MGNVLKSRLHFQDQTYSGEALLETSELLFRGERRLAVAFDTIEAVEAKDGNLRVKFAGGLAELELGADAAKWAEKICNPKSVIQKLGVKPGQQVSLVHLDDASFAAELEKAGAQVSKGRAKKNSDAIFYGASARAELSRLGLLRESLASNGALWVIRPKGIKEITEGDVMAAGKAAGLVDVKVVRFSDTHTAEKFVIPVSERFGVR